MNKQNRHRLFATIICVVLICCVITACQSPFGNDDYLNVSASPEQLRKINPIQLEQIRPDKQDQTEADQQPAPPEQLELTIEMCRAITMENNLDLKVEMFNPTIVSQSISEEEARFEALFFSNFNYHKTDTPVDTDLSGSQTTSTSADLGVRFPLRTGGVLRFNLPGHRFETDNEFSTLNPSYTTDFSASISQNLLRGAGIRTNTHGIRLAEYQTQAAQAQNKLVVIRVITIVDRAYWRLYTARKELQVRKKLHDLAIAQLERSKRMVAQGVTAEIEIIRAQAGVADRLEGTIIAENNLRNRQRDMKRILNKQGLAMDSLTILIPVTQPNPVQYQLDSQILVDAAIDKRMEMLELELRLAQDASNIDLYRNKSLPLVVLGYTYNINGLGNSWGNSFDLLADKDFEDHRVSLRIEVPLGNQAAKSQLRRAILTRLQSLATVDLRKAQIQMEVLGAIDQIKANWQRILASRQSTILSARTLAAEQRQFDLGLNTSTDVLDAQANLADAKSAEVLALADYQIAQIDLAFATGSILGATQIRWDPAKPADD